MNNASRVGESNPHQDMAGFDLPVARPLSSRGMIHYDCEREYARYPDDVLVKSYAQFGLHRYNLLEGTAWKFFSLKSFNLRANGGAAPYYITLVACDPTSNVHQIFQTLVCEEDLGVLDLSCDIARPLGSNKEPPPLCQAIYEGRLPLPQWPSEITDSQRFYLMNASELQNTDWIRLYLNLAHCTYNRDMTEHQLSKFDIVEVAIESLTDMERPRLDSTNVIIYIAYKDLAKAQFGKPCDRKVIIRRVFNESSRSLSLQGKHWRLSEKKKKKKKKRYAMLKRRLGVYQTWRLRLHTYNKCGFRSSHSR
ncbi:unnamed protein product [Eruca vesicaria subsp. sativa]|uniref:Uncharacterized protein n=1 Tax=Eruca vesicaria subsp. sativa TaxID=29727 RepID=A0ABC8KKB4_ERUVS|nr:unnamed protein product [Eruca vesicaria subsp. sativa]